MEKKVVLLIGTSGSGKSTFAKSLDGCFKVICADDLRVQLTGDINDKSRDIEVYEKIKEMAAASIQNNIPVVIDSTNLQRDRRRDFIHFIIDRFGFIRIEYKLFPLDVSLAEQRIEQQILNKEARANVSRKTLVRHAALYEQMLCDIQKEPIVQIDEIRSNQYLTYNEMRQALSEGKKISYTRFSYKEYIQKHHIAPGVLLDESGIAIDEQTFFRIRSAANEIWRNGWYIFQNVK